MTASRGRAGRDVPPGSASEAPHSSGAGARASASSRAISNLSELAASWGPTAGRVLLGLVLAWFGYHELVQPALWTGYVPFVHKASAVSVVAVLAHGWVLLVVAAALIAGIMTRTAAAVAALLLAQIVIWLLITAGLSDLTLRDAGVLGLALCLSGATPQRLALAS